MRYSDGLFESLAHNYSEGADGYDGDDDACDGYLDPEELSAALEDVELILTESDLAERRGWRARAACLNLRSELFFPKRNGVVGPRSTDKDRRRLDVAVGKNQSAASDLCEFCFVRVECLSEALHHGESGVWGGRTMMARYAITERLRETDPDRLNPQCGTTDGWFRHQRDRNDDPASCAECRQAAAAAGLSVSASTEGPLRRALGDTPLTADVLPDASEAVPALESLF